MPQNDRNSRGGSKPLTPKQKQAAIVLGVCVLVLFITIAVVSVLVSGARRGGDGPASGSQPASGSAPAVADGFDPSAYGDAVLAQTDDAGAEYISETIFVGDSNTYRYYQYALLELDQVVAVEGLGIQDFTTDKSIYFKGDDNGYSIPEALAKMKPRRIIVMMGTNNADGTMTAADFSGHYRTALEAIKTAYPYTDIIVAAVPPIPSDHSSYPGMSMETINQFNEALAQLCADGGYKFLNTNEVLVGDDGYGKAQYYIPGDVHLKKDALTGIMDYARTHAYLGTEDRRPDTDNIPERRRTGATGTVTPTPTPSSEAAKTYTAQYNVEKNVGGTLTSGDQKNVTTLKFDDLTASSSVSVTAVPADGYDFVKWSDGSTSATRTDKDFKQNLSVTAMFSPKLTIKIDQGSSCSFEVNKPFNFTATLNDTTIDKNTAVKWYLDGAEQHTGGSWTFIGTEIGKTYTIKAVATSNDRSASAEFKMTITGPAATGVSVAGGTKLSSGGGSVTLTATVTPSGASGTVSWSVSDQSAKLSATNGSSTTVTVPGNDSTSAKTYTVTAKIGDVSGTATITVEGAALQDMSTLKIEGNGTLTVNQQGTYTLTGAPEGAAITWSGAVNGSGSSISFTPTAAGQVTITASVTAPGYKNGSASITVTVGEATTGGGDIGTGAGVEGSSEPSIGEGVVTDPGQSES